MATTGHSMSIFVKIFVMRIFVVLACFVFLIGAMINITLNAYAASYTDIGANSHHPPSVLKCRPPDKQHSCRPYKLIPFTSYPDNAVFSITCSGLGWNYTIDSGGYNNEYTPSHGSTGCASVDWYPSGYPTSHSCTYYLFVPGAYGNALVYPGLYDTSGHKYYGNTIDESKYTDQLVSMGTFSNIDHVDIGDNDGQTGKYIGTGTVNSLDVEC
jgi:hypothetical protein